MDPASGQNIPDIMASMVVPLLTVILLIGEAMFMPVGEMIRSIYESIEVRRKEIDGILKGLRARVGRFILTRSGSRFHRWESFVQSIWLAQLNLHIERTTGTSIGSSPRLALGRIKNSEKWEATERLNEVCDICNTYKRRWAPAYWLRFAGLVSILPVIALLCCCLYGSGVPDKVIPSSKSVISICVVVITAIVGASFLAYKPGTGRRIWIRAFAIGIGSGTILAGLYMSFVPRKVWFVLTFLWLAITLSGLVVCLVVRYRSIGFPCWGKKRRKGKDKKDLCEERDAREVIPEILPQLKQWVILLLISVSAVLIVLFIMPMTLWSEIGGLVPWPSVKYVLPLLLYMPPILIGSECVMLWRAYLRAYRLSANLRREKTRHETFSHNFYLCMKIAIVFLFMIMLLGISLITIFNLNSKDVQKGSLVVAALIGLPFQYWLLWRILEARAMREKFGPEKLFAEIDRIDQRHRRLTL